MARPARAIRPRGRRAGLGHARYPGAGKTKKAYMWAYARGAFEAQPGVVYDFCAGRGGKYPHEFLKGWTGTLVVDAYGGDVAAEDMLRPPVCRWSVARASVTHPHINSGRLDAKDPS
ncbi:MAG: transposase [Rubrivivax sp.]